MKFQVDVGAAVDPRRTAMAGGKRAGPRWVWQGGKTRGPGLFSKHSGLPKDEFPGERPRTKGEKTARILPRVRGAKRRAA